MEPSGKLMRMAKKLKFQTFDYKIVIYLVKKRKLSCSLITSLESLEKIK